MRNSFVLFLLVGALSLLSACGKNADNAKQKAATPAAQTKAAKQTPATQENALPQTFAAPESVLYDAADDVYFVSNIQGSPLGKDNNGFISRIDATTHRGNMTWAAGGVHGVTLNAPKGSAIVGDELWVADIDTIRKFDLKTGAPKGDIPIPGATFLNDVTAAADGTVYVSDSGMKAGEKGFTPSGADAIYEIKPGGQPEKIASGDMLRHPNGVLAVNGNLWVNTMGANELYRIVDGKQMDTVKLPGGSLDGLQQLPNGDFLVSSWEAKAVFEGPAAGPFKAVIKDVPSPADIGYDSKRNILLIPQLQKNKVLIRSLGSSGGTKP